MKPTFTTLRQLSKYRLEAKVGIDDLGGSRGQGFAFGHLISGKKTEVPTYKLSFAWEKDQVTDVFRDLNNAIHANTLEHFMRAIVMTPVLIARLM